MRSWIRQSLGAGKLGMECPSCAFKIVVNKRWLEGYTEAKTGKLYETSPCPHCFKTARRK